MRQRATRSKPRKHGSLRPERRLRTTRRSPSAASVPGSLDRPANDTNLELDFVPEPGLEADLARPEGEFAPSNDALESAPDPFASGEAEDPDDGLEDNGLPAGIEATRENAEAELSPDLLDATAESDEEGETEVAEEPEPDDESAPASGTEKSDEPQSFLAMYFRDMAELSVLRPEEEFETARNIEEQEIDLWQALLSYAPWASHLVTTVEAAMGSTLPAFRSYSALSERVTRKASGADKKRLGKVIEALSSQIKELDIDRVFVDAALTELQRLNGAARMHRPVEGLGFASDAKSFHDFAATITRKSGIVKRAKNEFVKANLRLVVSIARRFNHGRLPLPDLIQEGNIGLMKAVERYDYRRGFRFSTYASWWIRHAISRALADKGRAVRLPVHMIDAYHRIAKSERELQSKLERPATTEEIASVTGIETEKLEKMRTFLADNPVSLDRSLSEDDGRRLIDVLVDPNEAPSPPEQMMNSETQQEMLKLLSVLKPIEADILRKRFGLLNDHERTLKEIGDEYRLSRERVRQLQEQALGKMRKAMSKREIL